MFFKTAQKKITQVIEPMEEPFVSDNENTLFELDATTISQRNILFPDKNEADLDFDLKSELSSVVTDTKVYPKADIANITIESKWNQFDFKEQKSSTPITNEIKEPDVYKLNSKSTLLIQPLYNDEELQTFSNYGDNAPASDASATYLENQMQFENYYAGLDLQQPSDHSDAMQGLELEYEAVNSNNSPLITTQTHKKKTNAREAVVPQNDYHSQMVAQHSEQIPMYEYTDIVQGPVVLDKQTQDYYKNKLNRYKNIRIDDVFIDAEQAYNPAKSGKLRSTKATQNTLYTDPILYHNTDQLHSFSTPYGNISGDFEIKKHPKIQNNSAKNGTKSRASLRNKPQTTVLVQNPADYGNTFAVPSLRAVSKTRELRVFKQTNPLKPVVAPILSVPLQRPHSFTTPSSNPKTEYKKTTSLVMQSKQSHVQQAAHSSLTLQSRFPLVVQNKIHTIPQTNTNIVYVQNYDGSYKPTIQKAVLQSPMQLQYPYIDMNKANVKAPMQTTAAESAKRSLKLKSSQPAIKLQKKITFLGVEQVDPAEYQAKYGSHLVDPAHLSRMSARKLTKLAVGTNPSKPAIAPNQKYYPYQYDTSNSVQPAYYYY